jgi:hypothetical protein
MADSSDTDLLLYSCLPSNLCSAASLDNGMMELSADIASFCNAPQTALLSSISTGDAAVATTTNAGGTASTAAMTSAPTVTGTGKAAATSTGGVTGPVLPVGGVMAAALGLVGIFL